MFVAGYDNSGVVVRGQLRPVWMSFSKKSAAQLFIARRLGLRFNFSLGFRINGFLQQLKAFRYSIH